MPVTAASVASNPSFLGKPRSLGQVVRRSVLSGLVYYAYYKWMIHDELKRYQGHGWSGVLCLMPFLVGIVLPKLLQRYDPDVPGWFGWFSLVGLGWIYMVQFRLYRTVNGLYRELGQAEPLRIWWLFVPGLNLLVGLRQIHYLSRFWAMQRGERVTDPVAAALLGLFGETSALDL
ncbi:MAG: hypothetical protein KME20_14180 [Kaiparowitsia implicata GSE-PSE-MK54-09C]|jgi:hypothetical protein|nr:hypothetical protein [Kaiparowitsia implicata GSE-PSE-MK54-09C]